jgi:hypothetical protein
MLEVHTALPGRVEKYDAAKQVADVSLQIQHVNVSDSGKLVASKYPVLANVPVAFPRGGGCFVSFPLAKGDFVFVIFSEAAIDQWRAKGKESFPGDLRRHGLTGAVALPCLYPSTSPISDASDEDMTLGKDGGASISIKDDVRVGAPDASDYVALASKVMDGFTTFQAAVGAGFAALLPAAGGAGGKTAMDNMLAAPLTAIQDVAADLVKAK